MWDLQKDPGPIAGIGFTTRGAAMFEIPEYFERLFDDFSRTPPFDIDDKAHPTRIMFKLGVVESLLLGNKRLFHAQMWSSLMSDKL